MDYHSIEVIVPGEPPTKARPRFTGKGYGGRAYTPATTRAAEEAFAWAVKAAAPGLVVDPHGHYRIWARLFQGTFHRRDLDNMIKLISDACNGVIWVDDAQVIAVDAVLERGSAEPRSHVIFTKMEAVREPPTASCALCGRVFRVYPSWPLRTACSAACAARLRSGVDLSSPVGCDQCAAPFVRRTSSQRFCSERCRRDWLRGRNRTKAIPNHCMDCGEETPNHRASRCRACWRKSLIRVAE